MQKLPKVPARDSPWHTEDTIQLGSTCLGQGTTDIYDSRSSIRDV